MQWADVSPHVDEALAELPDETRMLLVRHFLQNVSQCQLAGELRTSPATVSRKIKAGVESLRKQLSKKGVCIAAALLITMMREYGAQACPAALVRELGKITMLSGGKPAGAIPAGGIGFACGAWWVAAVATLSLTFAAICVKLPSYRPASHRPARPRSTTAAPRNPTRCATRLQTLKGRHGGVSQFAWGGGSPFTGLKNGHGLLARVLDDSTGRLPVPRQNSTHVSIPNTFAYRAQGIDGQPLTGTIDAASPDQARERLESLRLRVLELAPADSAAAPARPLKGEDFLTFNQQLAHLTSAGMPLEQGLRLIARDMHRGAVANTIRQIADELEKGVHLSQAFEKHAAQFPPAYGHLIDAGVRTNNLSGMLLNLSEHLRTLGQLRAALWRALAYPLTVFVALCCVVGFLGALGFPTIFRHLPRLGHAPAVDDPVHDRLQPAHRLVLPHPGRPRHPPRDPVGALRHSALRQSLRDNVVMRLPLIGPVVSRSLVSRWCDAVRLGVVGGMDLPRAMRTAGDAVGSARLADDGNRMAAKLEGGQPLSSNESFAVMPPTVPAAIELSSRHGGLAETLGTLAHMYQEQAQAKVGVIPAVLTPLLLTLLTGIIGFIILAMFLPFANLLGALGLK